MGRDFIIEQYHSPIYSTCDSALYSWFTSFLSIFFQHQSSSICFKWLDLEHFSTCFHLPKKI